MRIARPAPALAAAFLTFLSALPVHAVSNRIFMSTNGNNASDCANPLTPCLTFAGALAQVNPGGEVIAEATGGYGLLNVTQAVTISGPPGVVIYSGLSVTVNAPGATVVLRGLTIDGTGATGSGINVVSVGTLFVESCVITGFTGNGILVSASNKVYIKDTISRQNGGNGVSFNGAGRATIDHCRFEGNFLGGVLVDGGIVTVRDSVSSGNLAGFWAHAGATQQSNLNVYECISTNNSGTGFLTQIDTGSNGIVVARVANLSISENFGFGLQQDVGVTFESLGNNFVRGNIQGPTSGTITVVAGQ